MITKDKLVELENKYGGVVTTGKGRRSPLDPHKKARTHMGGDRMGHNGYAEAYAKHLPENPQTLVELGVLKGTGLAIWCDLYPNARVIGLDLNLDDFYDEGYLLKFGAFAKNKPETYRFDKFEDNSEFYKQFAPIDVWIDDSAHGAEGIMYAFNNVNPFLSDDFVCFIEDNNYVAEKLRDVHPELTIHRYRNNRITVITK